MTTDRILLSVDLSGESGLLVSPAIRFSTLMGARLHVVHVVSRIDHYSTVYMPGVSITKMEWLFYQRARRTMDAFSRVWFGETRGVKTAVLLGDVAQELICYIESEAISMVIMGNHARTGWTRFMLGSISSQVTRESCVPVLLFNLDRNHPYPYPKVPGNRPSRCPLPSSAGADTDVGCPPSAPPG